MFRSAQETDLERAIYRGVENETIRSASDLNGLAQTTFARYDPSAREDPSVALYWAHNRLFYTDPLYDVNYLFAGLLAMRYFSDFQRDPQVFARRYVALLKNGFNDSPAHLEKRFLGIDPTNEAVLVAGASALIDARTQTLAGYYKHTLSP